MSRLPLFDFDEELLDAVSRVRSGLERIFVFDPAPSGVRCSAVLSDRLEPDGSNIAGILAGLEKGRKAEVAAILARYLQGIPERAIRRVWAERVGVLEGLEHHFDHMVGRLRSQAILA